MKLLSQIAELLSTVSNQKLTKNYITTSKLDDWTSFLVKFNKSYGNSEELQNRKDIFYQNKEFIKNNSHFLTVNQFMDLTLKEYQQKILKIGDYRTKFKAKNNNFACKILGPEFFMNQKELPKSLDWSTNNNPKMRPIVPEIVKDQKFCGSCYIHSITDQLSSQINLKSNFTNDTMILLSDQHVLDCLYKGSDESTTVDPCNGGSLSQVYEYAQNFGIYTDQAYDSYDHNYRSLRSLADEEIIALGCNSNSTTNPFVDNYWPKAKYKIKTCFTSKIQNLSLILNQVGPVVVNLDASSRFFQFYSRGVFRNNYNFNLKKRKSKSNHAILAVGYDLEQNYFKLKNSFGPSWGDSGYILVDPSSLGSDLVFGII